MTQNSAASGLAMTTGGDYSLSTRGAKDVIDRATPRFRAALAAQGLTVTRSAEIRGLNYSRGQEVTIAVYARR